MLPGRSAREGGAQRARQRRKPPGQPRRQQVRAVGKTGGAAGGEQFVGPGEQGLTIGTARGILEHPGDDGGGLPRP